MLEQYKRKKPWYAGCKHHISSGPSPGISHPHSLQNPNQFRRTHVFGASGGEDVGVAVVVMVGAEVIECGTVVCEPVVVLS